MLTKEVFRHVNTVPHMAQVSVETMQKLQFELLPHPVDSPDLIHLITLFSYHSKMQVTTPRELSHFFLVASNTICALPSGDLAAIERVAYEFCEDKAKNGVLYTEARYSPHFLLAENVPSDIQALSEVVRAVNRGFARGEESFHIKVRSILCTLVGTNQALDVVELSQIFQNEGVVGIDMASQATRDPGEHVEVPDTGVEVEAFQTAAKLGIHRTVHAGETGSAQMVQRAIELYHAERIGHGYHVLEDDAVYNTVRVRDIHLENCPWSSYLTGSVPLSTPKHPVVQFAEDEVNFSISTDDPMVTGHELQGDYDLANYWGLTEVHLIRAVSDIQKSYCPSRTQFFFHL
ncbi:hypothetical protein Cfor_08172 [Coptotermes formosanus]|uniref:Adenosine deaminase n=1 Tax=Coptotermes formosanus TaxID=36987 RepID=A0A6L2PUS2_COPFO|nr:hypothetical protein Cfor_08172 [Coptotermes formosanus]